MTTSTATAQKRVLDQMLSDIVKGVLKPNEKLSEDALAKRYHVSRTPVRAAIRKLSAEGLVEVLPHKGARISPMTATDIRDCFEIRKILDCHAIRMACQHISESELRKLKQTLHDMEAAHRAGNFAENYVRLRSYHVTILRHMRNRHLEHAAMRVAQKFSLLKFLLVHSTGMDQFITGLNDILNHVKKRDPDAAHKAMEKSLDTFLGIIFDEIITTHPHLGLHLTAK